MVSNIKVFIGFLAMGFVLSVAMASQCKKDNVCGALSIKNVGCYNPILGEVTFKFYQNLDHSEGCDGYISDEIHFRRPTPFNTPQHHTLHKVPFGTVGRCTYDLTSSLLLKSYVPNVKPHKIKINDDLTISLDPHVPWGGCAIIDAKKLGSN